MFYHRHDSINLKALHLKVLIFPKSVVVAVLPSKVFIKGRPHLKLQLRNKSNQREDRSCSSQDSHCRQLIEWVRTSKSERLDCSTICRRNLKLRASWRVNTNWGWKSWGFEVCRQELICYHAQNCHFKSAETTVGGERGQRKTRVRTFNIETNVVRDCKSIESTRKKALPLKVDCLWESKIEWIY